MEDGGVSGFARAKLESAGADSQLCFLLNHELLMLEMNGLRRGFDVAYCMPRGEMANAKGHGAALAQANADFGMRNQIWDIACQSATWTRINGTPSDRKPRWRTR